jgi:hypothetical protein
VKLKIMFSELGGFICRGYKVLRRTTVVVKIQKMFSMSGKHFEPQSRAFATEAVW